MKLEDLLSSNFSESNKWLGAQMSTAPWLCFWGEVPAETQMFILNSFASKDFAVTRDCPSQIVQEVVICSRTLDLDIKRFVVQLANAGTNYIVVLLLEDCPDEYSAMWAILCAGASDVMTVAAHPDFAKDIAARFDRWRIVEEILSSHAACSKIVGRGASWRAILRQVIEAARFTDASILLIGASGTGKELIANLIHELDQRSTAKSLVIVDCATIVPELSGSEFFGHERGAFTGAVTARDGAFSIANDSTLFLDEIGELPLNMQTQLLRVIQEGTYKRVGGNTWSRTKFRLVCATNRNLPEAAAKGDFRSDLYFRIAGWVFRIPSLDERREDILPIARHFVERHSPTTSQPDFDPAVCDFLVNRHYPGNVRDLRQLVVRMTSRHVGNGNLSVGDIPEDERPSVDCGARNWQSEFENCVYRALQAGAGLKEVGQVAAETAIRIAVNAEGGNLQRAAKRLGVTDRALQMRRAVHRTPLEATVNAPAPE